MHDEELLNGLKKGDQLSFKKLVEEFQTPLLRLCSGFFHNHEDARDIVQETFIEVFESIGHFRADSKLSTWLYRIAVNKSLNLIRKRKVTRLMLSLDSFMHKDSAAEKQSSLTHKSDEADFNFEQTEKRKRIRKAVDALPENQRIAFILNKYQGLSYSEVSEIMAISISSTESLLHRAKLRLQKILVKSYKNNLL
jgi:RNA polymerase sigma factor (sigma-70 family)